MAPSSQRLVIITVHYRDPTITRALVASALRMESFDRCQVVIVDNAEAPATELDELTRERGNGIRILRPGTNLSYWPGAAYAIDRLYPEPAAMPEWVVVCNNDVVFDPGFARTVFATEPERCGVLAPAVISRETGRDQNPFLRRRWGLWERTKWRLYYTHYLIAHALLIGYHVRQGLIRRLPIPRPRTDGAPESVYAAHGACMVFTRRFFEAGGRLDTRCRMYAEELTVAETARRLELGVCYHPQLRVLHAEHATVGRGLTREKYAWEREAYQHLRTHYFRT